MKLNPVQMLVLTLGVLAVWSVRKSLREGKRISPVALVEGKS